MILVATLLCWAAKAPADSLVAAKFHALADTGRLPSRQSWIVVPPSNQRSQAVLLGDGTEVARLDSVSWKQFQAWRQDSLPTGSGSASPSIGIPAAGRWVGWIRPPSGGGMGLDWNTEEAEESSTWSSLAAQVSWLQSIGPWVSLGGGYGYQRQTPTWPGLQASSQFSPSVTACVPVVCWEMRQKGGTYPEAAIFEKKLDTLILEKRPGSLLTRVPGTGGGYWQHRIDAHAGVLHWTGTYAPDAWDGLVQEVSLRDLPAGPLRWGVSIAWTGNDAMTGFTLATTPWSFAAWSPGGHRQELSWEVLRLDLLFARTDQARFGLSTRFEFSDPLRPGAPQ